MRQMDLFEETLEKKIVRLERWIGRLNKEMFFLKEVFNMTKRVQKLGEPLQIEKQTDMFGT